MQKLLSFVITVVILLCGGFASAAQTNQATTNMVSSGATKQVVAPNVSNPEVQAQARGVLWMVLGFWVVAGVGALVVAGFALYGAYKKFGARGVALVVAILLLGLWFFGDFLLSF